MDSIQTLFIGGPLVDTYKSKHGITENLPMPELLVGIELEIESFPMAIEHRFGGITFKEDNSLRNNGIEAVTNPVAIKYVPAMLDAFFNVFGIGETNYSERCSTHVHFNVLNLTLDQISVICLLYQTTEKLLFEFVGHDRKQNIFCVPWFQSGINYSIVNKIQKKNDAYLSFRHWQKYSALNLIPVTSQGTLEFRHLHGTRDTKLITNWICIIAKMFEYAEKVSLEDTKKQILEMNTVSNYKQWLEMVFGDYAALLSGYEGFEKDLSMGVIESKLMLDNTTQPRGELPPIEVDELFEDELEAARSEVTIPRPALTDEQLNQMLADAPQWDAPIIANTIAPTAAEPWGFNAALARAPRFVIRDQVFTGTAQPRPAEVRPRAAPPLPRNPATRRGGF